MTRTVKYKQSTPIESVTYTSATNNGMALTLQALNRQAGPDTYTVLVNNRVVGLSARIIRLSREDLQSLSEDIITILMQTEGES